MTPDPRIKDVNSICTVLNTRKRSYTGRQGYFSDYLYNFENLDDLAIGALTEVDQKDEKPYQCNGARYYRYFLPTLAVNANLRPYAKEKDLPFKVGEQIFLRHKKDTTNIIHTSITGIYLDGDTIKHICFCDFKLTPFELLNYEYNSHDYSWNECGIGAD